MSSYLIRSGSAETGPHGWQEGRDRLWAIAATVAGALCGTVGAALWNGPQAVQTAVSPFAKALSGAPLMVQSFYSPQMALSVSALLFAATLLLASSGPSPWRARARRRRDGGRGR